MTPLELSDLPVASVAVDGDLMLLRKGLTDYQINVTAIRAINLSVYPSLSSAIANDLMLIQRTSSTFSIRFGQVGLLKTTRLWFYLGSPPSSDWVIVPNTGDRLLAVTSGSGVNRYNNASAGTQSGTWVQPDHTLTIAEIPAHFHGLGIYHDTSSFSNVAGPGKNSREGTQTTDPTGGGMPHNHGSSWRPSANIGIICEKMS